MVIYLLIDKMTDSRVRTYTKYFIIIMKGKAVGNNDNPRTSPLMDRNYLNNRKHSGCKGTIFTTEERRKLHAPRIVLETAAFQFVHR